MDSITMILDKHYQSLQEELQLRKLNACLKNCIWSHVQRLSLKTSMRLRITGDLEAGRFAVAAWQWNHQNFSIFHFQMV